MSDKVLEEVSKLVTLLEELRSEVKVLFAEDADLSAYMAFIEAKDNRLLPIQPLRFSEDKTQRLLNRYRNRINLERKRSKLSEDTLHFLNTFPARIAESIYMNK